MKKLKEKLTKLFNKSKKGLSYYKGTLTLIVINTLVYLIATYNDDIVEYARFLLFANLFVFATETFFSDKKKRYIFYALSIVSSFIFDQIMFNVEDISNNVILFILNLYFISAIMSIYKLSKDAKSFPKYIISLLNNNIILGIASFVVQIGLLFIVFILQELIFTNMDYEIYLRVEILFLGLFVVPGELLCLTSSDGEIIKQVKGLINYIVLPLTLISELIIYVYLFKVLFIEGIPSNRIFPIISFLIVVGYPTWVMINNYYKDNKFIEFNVKYMPYSFIPLILMQIYSMGVRVIDFGLTIDRYMGLILVIFEIVCVVLAILKEKYSLNYILIALSILTFITMSVPFINVMDLSTSSQLNRIKKIYTSDKKFDDLTEEEKILVKNSYDYIIYSLGNKKKLPDYIESTKIEGFYYSKYSNEFYYDKYDYITYNERYDFVPVSGYSSFKTFDMSEYYDDREKISVDNLRLYDVSNYEYKNNVKIFISDAIRNKTVYNNTIMLDENTTIYVTYVSIRYNTEDGTISNYSIDGYLLRK